MKTKQTLRFLTLPLVLACALALPIGSQADTLRVKPSAGDYQTSPKKLTGGLYQLGAFSVVNEGGKRRIVSTEALSVITYPYTGDCGISNIPLTAESIPINSKGTFSIRDKTKYKSGTITVLWKGAWSKPKKVSGTLKLTYGDCSSKIDWVGKRAAA